MTRLATDEQFIDLLCSDDELLRAEFDAIIAAQWPGTPPELQGDERAADDCGGDPARWDSDADQAQLPNGPRHAGASSRRRQRSPPHR